jgi:hypothetical protein
MMMSVMNVRIVRMTVGDRRVGMPVDMRVLPVPGKVMRMLMMRVVTV